VRRLLASEEPPRYRRAPQGSKVDPFEPVMRRVLEEWPEINAPRMTEVLRDYGYEGSVDLVKRRLRRLRPRKERPAQRFEDDTRVLPRGPRADLHLTRRVTRECVYDNLRSVVAKLELRLVHAHESLGEAFAHDLEQGLPHRLVVLGEFVFAASTTEQFQVANPGREG
jgi:hypothetical protein